eukprot:1159926-Pelagomonas_calceolata.AAC.4
METQEGATSLANIKSDPKGFIYINMMRYNISIPFTNAHTVKTGSCSSGCGARTLYAHLRGQGPEQRDINMRINMRVCESEIQRVREREEASNAVSMSSEAGTAVCA